jgi:deoxyribodipyrimidine photo-lyase
LEDPINFKKWSKGFTGIPIVDAGMRELWKTGYMHNRPRMIVSSFLVKNLLIHWRRGEEWFWDCLFDADAASNSASWQWVAGTGTDSTPYFRIFNPVTQGQKFDPTGEYIRTYVPELKNLPIKFLFSPWECPNEILTNLNFKLGQDYPHPIVDLKESRQRALSTYEQLRKRN